MRWIWRYKFNHIFKKRKALDKKIFIIAGEESGDQHAAALVKRLLQMDPGLDISGLGGKHLEAQGMKNVLDLTQLAITGISGVFGHLRDIHQAFKLTKAYLLKNPPDLVILIDYPGFNLRMAKWIKKQIGCPVVYYISPQIWAWKAKRIEIIKANVSHMAVILPFEKPIYEAENVPVTYVGHPLRDELLAIPSQSECRTDLNGLQNERWLAILPGSRKGELSRHMPVIMEGLKLLYQHPSYQDLKVVIPVAKSLNRESFLPYLKDCPFEYRLFDGQAQKVIQASDVVIVSSGTASFECAVLGKPSCIVYQSSWLNYYLAMRWMKVKYLGLANLLFNQMILPELLQKDFQATEIMKMVMALFEESNWRTSLIKHLKTLSELLKPADGTPLETTIQQLLKNEINSYSKK